MKDVDAYVVRLYSAFHDAPRPKRDEIAPHRCCECAEITSRLAPHEARDVPEDDMLWLGDTLPMLGPTAFRYYLPRFIEFCLKAPASMLDAVINYNLAPTGELDVGDRNRFQGFTSVEARAVLEFVEHRVAQPEADFDEAHLMPALDFWTKLARADEERSE